MKGRSTASAPIIKTRHSGPPIGTTSVDRRSHAQTPWQRTLAQATRPLRLTNGDGTPTAWWAFVAILAPGLVVLSIVAVAIFRI